MSAKQRLFEVCCLILIIALISGFGFLLLTGFERTAQAPRLEWEMLSEGYWRSRTPEGWLVRCGSQTTYVQDPNHLWLTTRRDP